MSAVVEAYKLPAEPAGSRGVWATAWRRLKNDRVGRQLVGFDDGAHCSLTSAPRADRQRDRGCRP
ncbi:MAG: hypothetical protein ACM3O5_10435, partial [Betaproteobacteria bacterium]